MEQNTYVGSKQIQIEDKSKNISFNVFLQYPTHTPSTPTPFGPYIMDVSINAEITHGKFPLVIISHGTGGSPFLYRTISTYLAKNGYIVAMIEHYGNNRNNNELEGKNENFTNRLKHTSQTIDYLFSDKQFAEHIQKDKVAVIGHSIGANSTLVLAGAIPISHAEYIKKFGQTDHMGEETQDLDMPTDERVKAVVLLSLTPGWFTCEDSLNNVDIPVLNIQAEKDDYIPKIQTELFFDQTKENPLLQNKIVRNAGHFSFLSPFPASIKDKVGIAAKDPEGFDREKFHIDLSIDILDFFHEKLK